MSPFIFVPAAAVVSLSTWQLEHPIRCNKPLPFFAGVLIANSVSRAGAFAERGAAAQIEFQTFSTITMLSRTSRSAPSAVLALPAPVPCKVTLLSPRRLQRFPKSMEERRS